MNVTLRSDVQNILEQRVRDGDFPSVEEAVNTLLSIMVQPDNPEGEELEELRKAIAVGLAEVERGDVAEWDPEALWDEVERRHTEETKKEGKRAG